MSSLLANHELHPESAKQTVPTQIAKAEPTPEAAPAGAPAVPTDSDVLKAINNLVDFVMKNGPGFEEIVRSKNRDGGKFRCVLWVNRIIAPNQAHAD